MKKSTIYFMTTYNNNQILNDYYGTQEASGEALREFFKEKSDSLQNIDFSKYKKGEFQKRIKLDQDVKQKYIDHYGTAHAAGKAYSILMHQLVLKIMQ